MTTELQKTSDSKSKEPCKPLFGKQPILKVEILSDHSVTIYVGDNQKKLAIARLTQEPFFNFSADFAINCDNNGNICF